MLIKTFGALWCLFGGMDHRFRPVPQDAEMAEGGAQSAIMLSGRWWWAVQAQIERQHAMEGESSGVQRCSWGLWLRDEIQRHAGTWCWKIRGTRPAMEKESKQEEELQIWRTSQRNPRCGGEAVNGSRKGLREWGQNRNPQTWLRNDFQFHL